MRMFLRMLQRRDYTGGIVANERYEEKERTRGNLGYALEEYINAARAYGMNQLDVAGEIQDLLDDANAPEFRVEID